MPHGGLCRGGWSIRHLPDVASSDECVSAEGSYFSSCSANAMTSVRLASSLKSSELIVLCSFKWAQISFSIRRTIVISCSARRFTCNHTMWTTTLDSRAATTVILSSRPAAAQPSDTAEQRLAGAQPRGYFLRRLPRFPSACCCSSEIDPQDVCQRQSANPHPSTLTGAACWSVRCRGRLQHLSRLDVVCVVAYRICSTSVVLGPPLPTAAHRGRFRAWG